MTEHGDWITPRVDGVRYLARPPLLYWLLSGSFAVAGTTPVAARLWSALAAVGVAAVTARLGVMLGGARAGLLAGLMVAANLGMFLCGRVVKPDLVFVLWLTLAWAGFAIAYRGGGRRGLALFYAALGLAAITKDLLGALGPLVVVVMFVWLTGERPLTLWVPWWSVLLLVAIALPWYVLVEAETRGFLWYTLVDNRVLRFAGPRLFPDEDVSLGSLEFLVVTLLAFVPAWSGVARIPPDVLAALDVTTRNLAARSADASGVPPDAWRPLLLRGAVIFGLGTLAMAGALWRRAPALGVGVALATTIAFLPTVAAEGRAQFVRARSVRPLAVTLVERVRPGDVVLHEGAIENSASALLVLPGRIGIVNGLPSTLAFGATFAEARDVFWDAPRLQSAWSGPERLFLLSAVDPGHSVVRALPPGSVHLLAQSGGRWLYSNLAEPRASAR